MIAEFFLSSLLVLPVDASREGTSTIGAAGQSAVPAAPQASNDLILEISAGRFGSDGGRTSSAGTSGSDSLATTIFMTDACSLGAGRLNTQAGQDPSTPAGLKPHTVWQVSGRVVDRTAYGLAVAIDWRRMVDGGRQVDNGPSGSMQVTMRVGERLLLDTVTAPSGASNPLCGEMSAIRLEAAVVTRAERQGGVRGGRGGGGRGVPAGAGTGAGVGGGGGGGVATGGGATGVGGGTGGGTGAGGAGASGVGVSRGSTSGGGGRGGGGAAVGRGVGGGRGGGGGAGAAGSGGSTASAGRGSVENYFALARRISVDFWLVHVSPNREEAVQRVTVRTAGATNFGFPAIVLSTPDGANVEVNGQVQLLPEAVMVNGQPVPDSARRLSVFIQRRIFTTADARGVAWSTTKVIEMPAAADVVEFELPPLEGDAYKGHKLSLRLRITQ